MRKPAWIRHRVMQTPWQHWSFALITVSVLGTLVAGFALAFDGWIDALALYAACVLLLALMLGHFAGQPPRLVAFADDGRTDPGACPASLVLTGTPGAWTGADRAAIPAALGGTPSME